MARLALALSLVVAQPGQPVDQLPIFETASVVPNTSGERGIYFNDMGGRFYATNATLRALIRGAYGPPGHFRSRLRSSLSSQLKS